MIKKSFDRFLPKCSFVAKIIIQSISKTKETKRGNIWIKLKVSFAIFSAEDFKKSVWKFLNKNLGKFSKYFQVFLTKNYKTMSYDFYIAYKTWSYGHQREKHMVTNAISKDGYLQSFSCWFETNSFQTNLTKNEITLSWYWELFSRTSENLTNSKN